MKIRKMTITSFEEAENYIDSTPRFTAKNTLGATRDFLDRLGSPDEGLRIIHVAGTNGKGSVCACIRSILEAAGYRTALFTSPHLVCIRERLAADGEMVSEEDFLRIFLQIYDSLDWEALERGEEGAYHPTYFEYLFLMAMLFFREKKPDFCILETGVGGRLDATNSVRRKELSVITHIGLDHVEYLGDTPEKIAGEKAGILQKGAPAVYWETSPEVGEVFRRRAQEIGISAYSVSENDYSFSKIKRKTIDFYVRTGYYRDIRLTLNTMADYQAENCAVALRAVEVLDRNRTITAQQVKEGVSAFFWAGRMEEVLPEVYVDGAHNADGIRAFLETVAADGHQGRRSLLFSVVRDKDYEHMAEALTDSGLFGHIAAVHMRGGRALETEKLKSLFAGRGQDAPEVYEDVESAFLGMMEKRRAGERLYVAGSLYLVGEIKELLEHDKFRGRIEEVPSQP